MKCVAVQTQRQRHAARLNPHPPGGGINVEQPKRPAGVPPAKREVGGAHRIGGAIYLGHADLVRPAQPINASQFVVDARGQRRRLDGLVCLHSKLHAVVVARVRHGRRFAVALEQLAKRSPLVFAFSRVNLIGQAAHGLELKLHRLPLGQRHGGRALRLGLLGLGARCR